MGPGERSCTDLGRNRLIEWSPQRNHLPQMHVAHQGGNF